MQKDDKITFHFKLFHNTVILQKIKQFQKDGVRRVVFINSNFYKKVAHLTFNTGPAHTKQTLARTRTHEN